MNLAEIKKAVDEQPDLKKEIISSFKDEFVKGAEAEGLIVRTKEDDLSFITGQVKLITDAKLQERVQPMVDAEFSKMMSKIDAEIQQITGIEKKAGEKTTVYAKRAVSEKATSPDPVTKEKVAELEKLVSTTKEEWEKKYSDLEQKSFMDKITSQVDAELDTRSFALPAHLKTDEEKQSYINTQKALLRQGILSSVTPKKDNEGNIVFYKGDKPLINTKDGKPKNASDIIGEDYGAYFIPKDHKVTGTGGGQGGGSGAGFKSKDDIHKHLGAKGLAIEDPEYAVQFEKLANDSKITI